MHVYNDKHTMIDAPMSLSLWLNCFGLAKIDFTYVLHKFYYSSCNLVVFSFINISFFNHVVALLYILI